MDGDTRREQEREQHAGCSIRNSRNKSMSVSLYRADEQCKYNRTEDLLYLSGE